MKSLDVTVSCSYVQIQHENVFDLFVSNSSAISIMGSLKIKEVSMGGNGQSPFNRVQSSQI